MEMINVDQRRACRISPPFSIEMKTEDEIGMQFCVHQHRPAPDFAVAIKQNLALKFDRTFLVWVCWIQDLITWTRDTVLYQDFPCEFFEIGRPFWRHRLSAVANEQNRRTKFS